MNTYKITETVIVEKFVVANDISEVRDIAYQQTITNFSNLHGWSVIDSLDTEVELFEEEN
jgi:hypothetical protein